MGQLPSSLPPPWLGARRTAQDSITAKKQPHLTKRVQWIGCPGVQVQSEAIRPLLATCPLLATGAANLS